jgi:phosphoadenosine phosphosulfate reductase
MRTGMNLWEKVELSKLLIEHAVEKHSRLFVSCSFGKDSRVLVDLAMQVRPDVDFVGIDTGYEFDETLSFARSLVSETGMNFRWVRPPDEARNRIEEEFGDSMIRNDRYKCCEMKVPALKTVLGDYDAWITGLRRDENEMRRSTPLVASGDIIKINAIAFWTKEDVWSYIVQRGLSYHPLYDAGYASLGCRPCTSKNGGSERAGRFAGSSHQGQECGLHL